MINPVLRKEIKASMRSWKIFLAIGLYLLIMFASVFIFIYFTQLSITAYSFNPQNSTMFYIAFSFIQLGFIIFISPALTAGSISGERERQTLDLILLTKMSPISIIIGKLLSSLGIVILMTIASFPIFAMVLNYSSISILNLLSIFAFFILISCTTGSIGIFFSTVFKRTSVATVVSYIFIFIICVLNFIVYIIISSLPMYLGNSMYSNNVIVQTLCDIFGLGTNPFIGFGIVILNRMNIDYVFLMRTNMSKNWLGIVNIIFNILLTVSFLLLSANNIGLTKSKVSKKGE